MNESDNHDDSSDDVNKPLVRRGGFDRRIALLTSLAALIIVLAFAVVMAFASKDQRNGASKSAVDVATMHLGADDATFTATTLPDAGLVDMEGKVTDLAAVAAGRPTMVNMFSNSCTACRTEMPALEKLHRQAGDHLNMVGVDLGDSHDVTKAFVAQTGVTYTIVRDPSLLLVERLNITAQPMTLWVDAKGKITGHRYGALTPTEMRLALKDHLGIEVGAG